MAKNNEPDKLGQEVSKAIAAGMSYGKWKAMQPIVPVAPKKPAEGHKEYTCKHCGCTFIRYDERPAKYCGDRCRKAAEKERSKNNAQIL